jgi:hypothetical protein
MDSPKITEPQEPEGKASELGRFFVGFPLAAFGGFITIVTAVFLCLYVASRFGGGPREPGLLRAAALWLIFGGVPLCLGKWILGSSCRRPFSRKTIRAVMVIWLVLIADAALGPTTC